VVKGKRGARGWRKATEEWEQCLLSFEKNPNLNNMRKMGQEKMATRGERISKNIMKSKRGRGLVRANNNEKKNIGDKMADFILGRPCGEEGG